MLYPLMGQSVQKLFMGKEYYSRFILATRTKSAQLVDLNSLPCGAHRRIAVKFNYLGKFFRRIQIALGAPNQGPCVEA